MCDEYHKVFVIIVTEKESIVFYSVFYRREADWHGKYACS